MIKLKTDAKFKEIEIDGSIYEIRVLGGFDREQYDDKVSDSIDYDMEKNDKGGIDIKPKGIKPTAGRESFLISLCLFDSEKKRVDQDVIKQWPCDVCAVLFDECEKFNKLGVYKEVAKEKN